MKYKMPHFTKKNADTILELKIIELVDDLMDIQKEFIIKNLDKSLDQVILFQVIRDASIAYAFRTIEFLVMSLDGKEKIPELIEECMDIIKCYADKILDEYK